MMNLRFRLLPAVMVSAAMLLSLKIFGLATGTPMFVAQVEASSDAPAESHGAAEGGAEGVDEHTPPVDLAQPPARGTSENGDLLEALAERRRSLDKREAELGMREKLLAAAEARIDEKIEELKGLKAQIDTAFSKEDERGNEKIGTLVKVYESMKPKEAAAIFEKLEMSVLLEVLERMNERKMAAVLAEMDPEKAQEVTVALATTEEDRLNGVSKPEKSAPMGLPELEPILPGKGADPAG